MRTPLVAGNWKMNGSQAASTELLQGLLAEQVERVDVVVCPSFVLLPLVQNLLSGSSLAWGGQDLDINPGGAFTGQISAAMLRDVGCGYVITGHSERRAYYGETDELVAQKTAAAVDAGLIPLACVGETLEQRERGETNAVIERQIGALLAELGAERFKTVVIAYEPVWAIGTGKTATPEMAQEVHAYIRSLIADIDGDLAQSCRILYGGSMKPDNAAELVAQPDVDGGLIGGASLNAHDFIKICKAAAEA